MNSGTTPKPQAKKPPADLAKTQTKDRDAGAVLRSVYQATVEERIPDEFMDLLGKLD